MKRRSMWQVVGALALVGGLVLGSTVAPAPAGANPGDVYLPSGTAMGNLYDLGGCRYQLVWGQFGPAPVVLARFYNLSACGGALVAIYYYDSSGTLTNASSQTVVLTNTSSCGTFQQIQANGPPPGIAVRALVWVGAGARFYANDGTASQPYTTC